MKAFRFSMNNGYVFDETIGKLASYEYKSAWCVVGKDEDGWNIDGGVTAIVGGVEKQLKNPVDVYANEEEYKAGRSMSTDYDNPAAFLSNSGKGYFYKSEKVWIMKGGKATEVKVVGLRFSLTSWKDCKCAQGVPYDSQDELYKWNDLEVVEADGTTRMVYSTAHYLALDDEQRALVGELKELTKRMWEKKIALILDCDHELYAYNVRNLAEMGDYCSTLLTNNNRDADIPESAVCVDDFAEYAGDIYDVDYDVKWFGMIAKEEKKD